MILIHLLRTNKHFFGRFKFGMIIALIKVLSKNFWAEYTEWARLKLQRLMLKLQRFICNFSDLELQWFETLIVI